MLSVKGSLHTAYREIDLALDKLPSQEQLEADLKSDNVYIVRRAAVLLDKLTQDGKLSQTYPYPVQVWRLGDLVITTLGGEVVVDYAVRLKNELPGSFNWVAGYCNDVMAYIPSARVLTGRWLRRRNRDDLLRASHKMVARRGRTHRPDREGTGCRVNVPVRELTPLQNNVPKTPTGLYNKAQGRRGAAHPGFESGD